MEAIKNTVHSITPTHAKGSSSVPSDLPKTYKRAAFHEKGGPLVIEDVELKLPGKGEVLAKVEACGVCSSDSVAQNNGYGVGFPIVPGHEIIGHVVALGEGVTSWKIGDRIGGPWHGGHDGTCKACSKGLYQMCDNGVVNGITRDGGYAQYVLLRSEAGVRIPTDVDAADYAPILCAGVTVFNGIRQLNIPVGSTVAIQGLGGLGHLAIQYCNKFGYRTVALSRDDKKEKFARELGAHEYIDGSKGDVGEQLKKLGGADLVVATVPSPNAIKDALKGLGLRGKLLILGLAGEVPVDVITLLRYGLSVHSWPSGHAADSEDAIAFTQMSGVKCMIEKFPLEKANKAIEAMHTSKVRFRAVLTME